MPIIEVQGLTKTYRVFQKKPGLGGALRGLVRREYKQVRAVDGVSFTIAPGETREVRNHGNEVATMIVVMPYPPGGA